MARKNILMSQIAKVLEIDPSTVSAKLNRCDRLKHCECVKIRDNLFPGMTIDYLFSAESKSNQDKSA